MSKNWFHGRTEAGDSTRAEKTSKSGKNSGSRMHSLFVAAAIVGAMGGTGLGAITALTESSDAHVPSGASAGLSVSASAFDLGLLRGGLLKPAAEVSSDTSLETTASIPAVRAASLDARRLTTSPSALSGIGTLETVAFTPAPERADGFDRAVVMEEDFAGFHHDLFATTLASLDTERFSGALAQEVTVTVDDALFARLSFEEMSGQDVALLYPLIETPRSAAPVDLTPSTRAPRGGTQLAYAPAEEMEEEPNGGFMDGFKKLFNRSMGLPGPGSGIAVYDIKNAVVYMPNGQRLEAHSGLGHMKDNPKYTHVRMKGATPPNIYNLRMREARFHGVEAIRLLPTDHAAMRGRDGILAHTQMLRGTNGSNGCVSFKHYNKFLAAFKRGEVDKIIVVPDLSELPTYMASL